MAQDKMIRLNVKGGYQGKMGKKKWKSRKAYESLIVKNERKR